MPQAQRASSSTPLDQVRDGRPGPSFRNRGQPLDLEGGPVIEGWRPSVRPLPSSPSLPTGTAI